jgi:hypothetical protein
MNQGTIWTRGEEVILREGYGRLSMEKLQELLPDRSAGAIRDRIRILELEKPNTSKSQEVARLKRQLAISQIELDLECAEKALTVFEDDAIRRKVTVTPVLLRERAKLISRVSNLRTRLFKQKLNGL